MRHNQKGFTLPELLIGLAISSIIIGASFGSYIVIKNNYDFQKDMKNISQSSRAVATMIMRDVRLAGYNFDDGPGKQNPVITTPVKITDGGTAGPDSIEVIYDQSFTERLKISYYSKPYPNTNSQRSRLYKKVERCDPSVNCSAGSLVTVIPESPIADYIEDFQLTGSKNGNALGTGSISYGQGNLRMITPTKITHTCGSGTRNTNYLIDSSLATYFECVNSSWVEFKLEFDKKFRPIKYFLSSTSHLDGGSISNTNHPYSTVYPYGSTRPISYQVHFYNKGLPSDCAWNSTWAGQSNCNGRIDPVANGLNFIGANAECEPISQSGNDCLYAVNPSPNNADHWKRATNKIEMIVSNMHVCTYTAAGNPCNPRTSNSSDPFQVAYIGFYGEVYGETQDPQEVEIGLLIRSPEQHGSTPIAQTWNVGNRPISTNDNYIRDAYSISALVRNKYYE